MLALRKLWRIVRLGIKNLWLHKMRSALTMLGIVFGVCSVIAMMAIGEGAKAAALEAIRRLGSTNIIVRAVKPTDEGKAASSENSYVLEYGLTYEDAWRIVRTVPGVVDILPTRNLQEDIQFGGVKSPCVVVGTLPNYAELLDREVSAGRFLSETDERRQVNVCVLSAGLADRLFPYQDPLDETVRIGGNYYRVVGLLGQRQRDRVKAVNAPSVGGGNTWQREVYIPLSTNRALFGETVARRTTGSFSAERVELHEITVRIDDVKQVEAAARTVQRMLEKFHDRKDYEVVVPLAILRAAEETERRSNIVLGSIAAISLLVGGIGIMNIMLATVTERTREIGIRRALGAKRQDIVVQFLVETVALCVFGGLTGVLLGVLLPLVVTKRFGMPTIVTPWAPVLAFSISLVVGLVFGIYPARRAASLDPIIALRHE